MKLEKKGQITLFLIVGIILILLIGIFIYVQRAKILRPIEEERPIVAEVPLEAQPINDYTTNCIYDVAKDGLIKLGDHGGYIDHRRLSFNPIEPTTKEAVQFSKNSDLVIPYWWYMSAANPCQGTCEFSTERPPLYQEVSRDSIESQLNEYIDANLKACINNFKPFTEQGFSFMDGQVKTKTSIAQNDVFFLVNYPVTIKKQGNTFEIEEYAVEIPLNLREIYFLATNITNLQAQYGFIEKDIRQLIDVFSSLHSGDLPPVSELDIEFGTGTVWIKTTVIEKLKEILVSYIPLLQVAGTRNYRFIESPVNVRDPDLYETIYNRGMIIPLEEDHPSLNVRFSYLDLWEPYFDLNCRGELCQPDSMGSTLGFVFGIQRYNFAYDVSLPVLVEISNPDAFGGEGYSFKFFLEANMRNNRPMTANFAPLETISAPRTSLLCDLDKRSNHEITINVIDGKTKQKVDAADITLNCGSESCTIGRTINGSLTANFPRCLGGIAGVDKTDYESGFAPLDTYIDRNQEISIFIEPYRFIDFKVKKYLLKKNPLVKEDGIVVWRWRVDTQNIVNQEFDEDTLIMLERIGEDYEKEFTAVAEICGTPSLKAEIPCGNPPEDISQDIKIIPGKYKINLYTFKYPKTPVIIPPKRHCEKTGVPPFEKKKCYYIPKKPIEFNTTDPLPSGMSDFEFEIKPQDLDSASAIELYYINFALDKVPQQQRAVGDLSQLDKLDAYSEEHANLLKPTFVRE